MGRRDCADEGGRVEGVISLFADEILYSAFERPTGADAERSARLAMAGRMARSPSGLIGE